MATKLSSVSTAVPPSGSVLTSPKAHIPPANEEECKRARTLVHAGRKALLLSPGYELLKHGLSRKLSALGTGLPDHPATTAVTEVIVDNWIEELLRFLTLKTMCGDTAIPFQLEPSGPLAVAWKALLVMPTFYAQVCFSMGNDRVIDHDPFDTGLGKEEAEHKLKRLHATMRAYSEFFEHQPPKLYWSEPKSNMSAFSRFIQRFTF